MNRSETLSDDARDVLRSAAEKIGDSLADIFEAVGEDGDFSCKKCGCNGFVSTPESSRPSLCLFPSDMSALLHQPPGLLRRQPVVQVRSFSGLRTAQMRLIRSPATSNANTVTVTPSS